MLLVNRNLANLSTQKQQRPGSFGQETWNQTAEPSVVATSPQHRSGQEPGHPGAEATGSKGSQQQGEEGGRKFGLEFETLT